MLKSSKISKIDDRDFFDEKSTKFDTQKLETTPSESTVISIVFDLASQDCLNLSFEEVLQKDAVMKKKPCLLYIVLDSKETLERLFKAYNFNPLIQSECSEWSFKEKDYVMYFESCFFMAISDCCYNEDIENPIPIKMLIFSDFFIVISLEKLHFIEKVFKDFLNFKNFPTIIDPDEGLCLITGNHDLENTKIRADRQLKVSESTHIETILHLILDSLVSRYEKILFALLVECRTCLSYSTEISYKERVEYLVRVSVSEKSLVYFDQLIKPKQAIVKSLLIYAQVRNKLRPYLESLQNRINKMSSLAKTGMSLLHAAKNLFSTCADDKISNASFGLGKMMQFFSGITTLFLPPFLASSLWGTNVKVPASEEDNLNTFALFSAVTLVYLVAGVFYFRKIGWI
jgi:Mg2+ and Co2+ transporter CorA